MSAPTHRLVDPDIKFRQAKCGICQHVKQVRWFPWNSKSTVARGWVCFPCFLVLREWP